MRSCATPGYLGGILRQQLVLEITNELSCAFLKISSAAGGVIAVTGQLGERALG
jgi:hypothetical protein